jgi:hypothetical protein
MREARETLQELGKRVETRVGQRSLMIGPGAVIEKAVSARAKASTRSNNPTPGSLKASPKVVKSRKEKRGPRAAVLVEDPAAVPKEYGLRSRNYPPEPFFRPAVDASREQAGQAMAEALKSEVAAEIAKVAKG